MLNDLGIADRIIWFHGYEAESDEAPQIADRAGLPFDFVHSIADTHRRHVVNAWPC